jgi:hypothetical protein
MLEAFLRVAIEAAAAFAAFVVTLFLLAELLRALS